MSPKIVFYGEDVIGIQFVKADMNEFVQRLKELRTPGQQMAINSERGKIVFMLSPSEFIVNIEDLDAIVVTLTAAALADVVDAIDEWIEVSHDFNLDHSFEAAGAKVIPALISDVVLETA
jgi:hypothetical protein